jgi:hypothetical protein
MLLISIESENLSSVINDKSPSNEVTKVTKHLKKTNIKLLNKYSFEFQKSLKSER